MSTLLTTRYVHRSPFGLEAMGVLMPELAEEHPNRAPFSGVVTRVDEASTKPPNGASGHKVYISRAVAEAALPTLIGMGVDVAQSMKDHDKRNKIGVITEAHIEGQDLAIQGYFFAKDFSSEVSYIQSNKEALGFSYEISDVQVEDVEAPIWVLTHFIFTGAAILEKNSAAYFKTSIAAQVEEAMSGLGETIVKKLDQIDVKLRSLEASKQDEADAEAGKKEAEAKEHDEAAARATEQAQQARKDEDEDDACDKDAAAEKARLAASTARLAAAKHHEDAAVKLHAAAEKAEEDAAKSEAEAEAKRHEEEAARLKNEDAAHKAEAEAAKEDVAQAKAEQDAAAKKEKMQQFFASMRAMMPEQDAANEKKKSKGDEQDDWMTRMFGMFMRAMTYSPGMMDGAKHDDKDEDVALMKEFLRKAADKTTMAASRTPVSLEERRRMRQMEAAVQLLTDKVDKMMGLITDVVHSQRNLATDGNQGKNGGVAQRRTMQATTEHWVDKQYGEQEGKGEPKTEEEFSAALDAAGVTDPAKRIAAKVEWNMRRR